MPSHRFEIDQHLLGGLFAIFRAMRRVGDHEVVRAKLVDDVWITLAPVLCEVLRDNFFVFLLS